MSDAAERVPGQQNRPSSADQKPGLTIMWKFSRVRGSFWESPQNKWDHTMLGSVLPPPIYGQPHKGLNNFPFHVEVFLRKHLALQQK